MKLTAQIKLLPTPEQADALLRTLEAANAACNDISGVAWQQTFGKFDLQKLTYDRIKAEYRLGAQMVIRCLAKVGDSYKLDRKTRRNYTPHGSIAFDDRILSFILTKTCCRSGPCRDACRCPLLPVSDRNACFKHTGARATWCIGRACSFCW